MPGREKAPSNLRCFQLRVPRGSSFGLTFTPVRLPLAGPAPVAPTPSENESDTAAPVVPPTTIPEGLVSGDPAPLSRLAPLSEEFGASRISGVPRSGVNIQTQRQAVNGLFASNRRKPETLAL